MRKKKLTLSLLYTGKTIEKEARTGSKESKGSTRGTKKTGEGSCRSGRCLDQGAGETATAGRRR